MVDSHAAEWMLNDTLMQQGPLAIHGYDESHRRGPFDVL